MRKILVITAAVLVIGLLGLLVFPHSTAETALVTRGPFQVWTVHPGLMESRDVLHIMSNLSGPATIVELVADGASVHQGDLLVRFDASPWERDYLRAERDWRLAKADLESLEKAKLPMELRDLQARRMEAESRARDLAKALEDSRELLQDGLIPEYEVTQLELRSKEATLAVENLQSTEEATRKFIHPSILERAQATLSSAENELALLRSQISNCVITAAADGVAVLRPIAVGSDFRTVRIGDTVFRNQPFLILPDVSNLVVRCDIPESELELVHAGAKVSLKSLSHRTTPAAGEVESVGSMAFTPSGKPGTLKYFSVTIRPSDSHSQLRPGMSVQTWILAVDSPSVLQVPRTAVWWQDGSSFCKTSSRKIVPVRLGLANDTHFEVLDGLQEGDTVLIR